MIEKNIKQFLETFYAIFFLNLFMLFKSIFLTFHKKHQLNQMT